MGNVIFSSSNRTLDLASLNWGKLHASTQGKDKLSELIKQVKPALCQIASLSHHPVTLVSTLPVSQLACQVSHDPLLLCCCFVLRESRTAGMRRSLMGFSCRCSMWEKEHKHVFISSSLSLYCPLVKQAFPHGQNVSFGVKLEEVHQCQRGWVSSEHTEHIPEGSRGCDFSRLSQGLGYSVCLCELMLLLSQCLSNPVEQCYTICSHCEERQGSIILIWGLFTLHSKQLLRLHFLQRSLRWQSGK